ncbi:hypothetical protein SAMN05216338_101968 [Bradyrhizobium sp. Rc2d]|uniref:hypothetical protein n=1 Tax=Bradyrhizobium sp. Rc2d TaxID=1855321 RepID=UPI00087E89F4|nr:hypothetical protein [Bradyrhizobium sp. Rc2d]SDI24891.1 hypothetical protein SAMN05216338_101968 [Bradyrhizobium sp. Rc2d]
MLAIALVSEHNRHWLCSAGPSLRVLCNVLQFFLALSIGMIAFHGGAGSFWEQFANRERRDRRANVDMKQIDMARAAEQLLATTAWRSLLSAHC